MRLLLLLALLAVPTSAQTVWYVDADATGSASGLSWADAFPDLQLALGAAEAGDEVWVAEGLYRPTSGSDRTVSFVLPSGVALYGGFDGTETDRDERDWTLHETILSGDVGVPGDSTDNAYHVVVASGTDSLTVLDGFTVEYGMARGGEPPHDRGAGILIEGGSPTIRNCYFFRNIIGRPVGGLKPGGAIYSENGAPLIEDSVFEENLANGGGGVYFDGSDPILRRVVLRDNAASQLYFAGGSTGLVEDVIIADGEYVGLIIVESSPHFIRVTVRGNLLHSGDGGGAGIRGGATPVFEDSIFENNRATNGGGGSAVSIEGIAAPLFIRTVFRENVANGSGAVTAINSSPVFLFCQFERNQEFGSGALFSLGSALTVLASTFVGNTSTWSESTGGAILFTGNTFTGEPIVVASSLFVGNEANSGGAIAGFGIGPGEARIINSTLVANEGREVGGAVYASNASGLEIQNSVLWGNTAPDGPEVFVASGAPPMIAQSIVAGGYPSGSMILDEDPQFVRAPDPGPDNQWGTPDDDYGDLRLSEGSPAVDYGLADYLPPDTWDLDGDGDTAEPLPVDLAGSPRQIGASPDLGAYEGAVLVATEPETPNPFTPLAVWPNPASGVFRIRSAPHAEAVITDVLGREVRRVRLGTDGVAEVATAGLAAGVYVVRVGRQSVVVTVQR